jgi:hypothetical protein
MAKLLDFRRLDEAVGDPQVTAAAAALIPCRGGGLGIQFAMRIEWWSQSGSNR